MHSINAMSPFRQDADLKICGRGRSFHWVPHEPVGLRAAHFFMTAAGILHAERDSFLKMVLRLDDRG